MKTQHTPGQFKIVHTGKPYPIKDCKDKWSCIDIPGQFSFDIIFPEVASPEQVKKITNESAAAPELLEALEACKVTLEAFLPDAFATISVVKSAIAKAKGE